MIDVQMCVHRWPCSMELQFPTSPPAMPLELQDSLCSHTAEVGTRRPSVEHEMDPLLAAE